MPTSGVDCPEELKAIIRDMTTQDKTKNYLWAVFELVETDGGKAHEWVVVDTTLKFPEILKHHQIGKEEFVPHYEKFYDQMKGRQTPVFALFDLSGCKESTFKKTIGVQWCPDDCPIKQKMMFAASVSEIVRLASDSTRVIKTNDAEDIIWSEVSKA